MSLTAAESLKTVPAAGVIATAVSGMSLTDWAAAASILWIVYLFAEKLYDRHIKPRLEKRRGRRRAR